MKVISSTKSKKETTHAITCEIIWPRPTIFSKTYAKFITLVDKKLPQESLNAWLNSILFKETTEGKFGVKLSISRALSDSEIASFVKTLLKTSLTAGANAVDDFVDNDFLSDVLQGVLKYGATELSAASERQVATVEFVCDTAEISAAKSAGIDVVLPLVAPKDWKVSSTVTSPVKGTRSGSRQLKLLAKGENNGAITIHLTAS